MSVLGNTWMKVWGGCDSHLIRGLQRRGGQSSAGQSEECGPREEGSGNRWCGGPALCR